MPALLLAVACGQAPALRAPVVSTTASSAGTVAVPSPSSASAAPACRRGTEKLLASLRSPMHVDAFVTKGLPRLDAFVERLESVLERDANDSAGRFDFKVTVARSDAARKRAKDAGLVEQSFAEATQGYMGLVFHYGDVDDVIKFLPPDRTDGLEFWIANKIRELYDKVDGIHHAIGVLTGHDEIKLSEPNLVPPAMGSFDLQKIITQNFPFYDFVAVDLSGGDRAVPGDLEGLIVTQPSRDVTDKELRRVDDFVMEGKPVAAFVSSVNVRAGDASMAAALDPHGLEKLLAGYGIELRRDAVVDFGSPLRLDVPSDSGLLHPAFPALVQVMADDQRLDTTFPPFFRMEGVVFPLASSIVLHPEKQPDAELRVVARTTDRGARLTGPTAALDPFQAWKANRGTDAGPYGVAAEVEGTLRAAFPGATRPRSAAPARVFVVASSQFLANPLVRAAQGAHGGGDEKLLVLGTTYAQSDLTTSILAFKNTLDWMIGDADLLACASIR